METYSGKLIRCPGCGGRDVRRSWPRGIWDRLILFGGWAPLRCRKCEHRFYRRVARAKEDEPKVPDGSGGAIRL
ncbi:MAG TPA: hypothetical protein VG675_11410 [Bryobacteraceae bacterium]|nr:hypothetical protein [Bryobacteraceae bacterium]